MGPTRLEDPEDHLGHAQGSRARWRVVQLMRDRRLQSWRLRDVITGPLARPDQAACFELVVVLKHSRWTQPAAAGGVTHRRHLLAITKQPGANRLLQVGDQPLIALNANRTPEDSASTERD